jgi:hypothetical protein
MGGGVEDIQKVCVKVYAPEPRGVDDQTYVPIFHEWIRDRLMPEIVLFDVADYAHAPDSPGIMLVSHEVSFALDRSDGRFGILGQRRIAREGGVVDAISRTLRSTLQVAARLEQDGRLAGRLKFDPSTTRVESNDRLRAPNTDEGFRAFEPFVRKAVEAVYGGNVASSTRVANDPRDRLTVDVRLEVPPDLKGFVAA